MTVEARTNHAIVASSTSAYAVYGTSSSNIGVSGNSESGIGVKGSSDSGSSIFALSNAAGNTSPTLLIGRRGASTADLLQIQDDSSAVMTRIDSTGQVAIGIAPNAQLSVGDTQASSYVASFANMSTNANADGIVIGAGPTTNPGNGNDFIAFADGDGTVIGAVDGDAAGGVRYNTTSDRRLKENIRDTHFAIENLMSVQVRDYNFITAPDRASTGFIAQELYEIYPEAVSKPDDESKDNWAVDYGRLTPLIVKGVQDVYNMCKMSEEQMQSLAQQVALHDRKIASVETKVSELEAANAAKDREIQQLKQQNNEIKAYLCSQNPDASICH